MEVKNPPPISILRMCLKMNNWVNTLFNNRQGRNLLKMFTKKRNNRWMMWASMLGLGVSAAVGLRGTRTGNILNPIQNVMDNIRFRNPGQMPKMANLTEFAQELGPDKMQKPTK